jgi:hypothetical protein
MDKADMQHGIGNPLFAIETNLITLGNRALKHDDPKGEMAHIIDEMQRSIERIKGVLAEKETLDPAEPRDHPDDTYTPTQNAHRVMVEALREEHELVTKFRDDNPLASAALRREHARLVAKAGFDGLEDPLVAPGE